MKILEFKVGDFAWIHNGSVPMKPYSNPLVKGEVVHKFRVKNYFPVYYVIELQTAVDPIFEVRDGFTMSDTADGPIGMWRRD